MTEPDLLTVSASAFVAVLALLALLAGMIRLLTAVFPGEAFPGEGDRTDAAVLAAIAAAAAHARPGHRITRVEEIR
jgi:hypothetical protein